MNIFEDLVEELKEENLLEETFIETNQEKEPPKPAESESLEDVLSEFKDVLDKETQQVQPEMPDVEVSDDLPETEMVAAEVQADEIQTAEPVNDFPKAGNSAGIEIPTNISVVNEAEFYSKRATDEVTGLQLVEHVFSGVEREQMKVIPKPYDDLECKKALHAFLQVSQNPNSPEHAKAEFHLMQETESWYSALSHRDKNISVTHLRRYCETTRPLLSSVALISLARFYRNSPFSEQVRSKFDLTLTRLFTKELENEKRELPFTREELIKHLTMLYSQWSSISLYSANDDDSDVLIITLKFEDFMAEAEAASSFDELVKNDFFNRLRNFKESTHENFFAPLVTATAIECNVRIGNRYVDLIQTEKQKVEKEILEDKYGFLHDQAISESSSKTLQLVQLLRQNGETPAPEIHEVLRIEEKPKATAKEVAKNGKKSLFKVNKWLLTATILIVVINLGLYIWMTYMDTPEVSQQKVEKVNLENSVLRDYVREARIANQTFFGVVQPNWNTLEEEKQQDIMKKIFNASDEKGFSKVHLLDKDGKTVGYMDATNLQTY